MAVDMFLDLKGIPGESIDSKHKGKINVLAWSWGMANTGTTHLGSGGGAGKVNVQDMSLTKYVDKASPVLMLHCCQGTHIPEGKLIIRKAGGKNPLEYMVFTIKDIIVTNVSTGGSANQAEILTENVTLNFREFKYEYSEQKPDGSGAPAITAAYNIGKNQVV
jgi:type VI secretion system secreted protein Hcp